MTTLVAYGSKTGTAKDAAEQIAALLPDAELVDLSKETPSLATYDAAVIGGGIRVGSVHKDVQKFIVANGDALAQMPVAFYFTNCFADSEDEILEKMLPANLREHASFAGTVGGRLEPSKLKALEKAVVKMVMSEVKEGRVVAEDIDANTIKRLVESVS